MQTKLKTQERLWFYYFLQTNFYTSVFSSFALTHRKKILHFRYQSWEKTGIFSKGNLFQIPLFQ